MVSSISNSAVSSWASSLFSKLDTKNQGYIEKSDLESAFTSIAKSTGTTDDTDVDALFNQLDADSDGKVTESELSTAMNQVADQLDTQYYQTRMQGAMPPPPPPPEDGSTSSTDSTYIEAADTNGDGEVSAAELAAYYASQNESTTSSDSDVTTISTISMVTVSVQPPPPPEDGSTSSTDSTYIEAADANGDGEVSAAELTAYYASQNESTTSSDSDITTISTISMVTVSVQPPPPPDIQSAASAGFTRDELISQLDEIAASDSKRSNQISSIVQNFDKADTNDDGLISVNEARAYAQSNNLSNSTSESTASEGSTDANAQVQITTMKLMQVYGVGQDASVSNTSILLSTIA